MRRILCLALLGLTLPCTADTPSSLENPPPYPQVGSNLPGPFTSIGVNGPKRVAQLKMLAELQREKDGAGASAPIDVNDFKKGTFQCLISENNLDPGVLVFIKGTTVQGGLKYFLGKLENAVEKNNNIRLAGFAVFYVGREEVVPKPPSTDEFAKLRDVIEKLTGEGDRLDRLHTAVADLVSAEKLDYVKAAFAPQANLAKYKIDDKTDVTVVLYDRLRVVATVWSLKLEEMTEEKAKEILGVMAEKLGAKRS